ncbi:GtrA family protein [Candidatus Peregrinibacteria bacterium]|nr:GtrA family protein [Candidatus Peregrinibacteria bacterium]MBT3598739.1 GtrA family protein [Candidatus Peregrinibacteria bacterium]MBT6731251.1 GtrA family protein [Candidatus Peregrinibacteria bacterium]MBT7008829.1 GtrA family protein [Candidatus Peregrinibacteria bacterium]MBT7344572.1 GtrA family protein [Candidatus Peregrinibacteria bacterium]
MALVIDFGSFMILLNVGFWYLGSSIVGSTLGFCTAFLSHKYLVFRKDKKFLKHLGKYALVDLFSTSIATALLFALVEFSPMGEELSKIISMGSVVLWNFFLYKFFVYV